MSLLTQKTRKSSQAKSKSKEAKEDSGFRLCWVATASGRFQRTISTLLKVDCKWVFVGVPTWVPSGYELGFDPLSPTSAPKYLLFPYFWAHFKTLTRNHLTVQPEIIAKLIMKTFCVIEMRFSKEYNSQTAFPCTSLNHKRTRVMQILGI